jgi:hypothetical protein
VTTKAERVLAILGLATAAGLVLFWVGFFTIGLAPERPPACYFAYEHSFPLPDGVLALALLVGGVSVLRGRAAGRTLMLVCAGGLVFLGLLDASFNLQQGVYRVSTTDLVLNAFLNVYCVVFGALLAMCFGRRGAAAVAASPPSA